MPYLARRAVLTAIVVLCTAAAPALAEALGSLASPAPASTGAESAAAGAGAAVTVRFTVRPVIVVVVDNSGAPMQLWTNVPGTPTPAALGAVQARLDNPRGAAVAVNPALESQLPALFADAGWGHQGLVWQRG